MTRDDFMEFFRDTEKLNTLSTDDRLEIFQTILTGSSDVTKENLDSVISEYGADFTVVGPIETEVRETLIGYQAGFKIGNQTFYFDQWDAESKEESLQQAKWQCEQLEKAFEKRK